MNAREARQVLLVRACETARPALPDWREADGHWAGLEALRTEGEGVSFPHWLARRAEFALTRLGERLPDAAWLRAPPGTGAGSAAVLVGLALLAGLASNLVGPDQRIQLLAPPLLALLVWNLAVYAMLAGRAVMPRGSSADRPAGPVQRLFAAVAKRMGSGRRQAGVPAALQSFAAEWARASLPLQSARGATALHLAAAALAVGAIAGLYLRGLAFEFRAGWDSTFLSAEAVADLLHAVLGPAAAWMGEALPDAQRLEALRFSRGPGENAARWIHLHAITAVVVVLLPRALLALAAGTRAARLQRQFPLPLEAPYFQRLAQALAHAQHRSAIVVAVLPYSYQVGADRLAVLTAALAAELGPGLAPTLLPSLAMGDEDDPARWARSCGPPGALRVPLFAATATPERELQGAFLRRLRADEPALLPTAQRLALVDESGFRKRLAGADRAARTEQRRQAWRGLLDETGHRAVFVDLAPDSP